VEKRARHFNRLKRGHDDDGDGDDDVDVDVDVAGIFSRLEKKRCRVLDSKDACVDSSLWVTKQRGKYSYEIGLAQTTLVVWIY